MKIHDNDDDMCARSLYRKWQFERSTNEYPTDDIVVIDICQETKNEVSEVNQFGRNTSILEEGLWYVKTKVTMVRTGSSATERQSTLVAEQNRWMLLVVGDICINIGYVCYLQFWLADVRGISFRTADIL